MQIIRQCPKCGVSVGGAVKKAPEHASVPAFDEAIALEFEAQKQTAYREILARHLALQLTGKAEHQKEYAAYRETPEWGAKRGKVLERAQGLCEGCRESPAVEVRPLTYDHIYDEFLFELAAVCRSCHERLHGKDGAVWTEFYCEEVE